MDFNLTNGTEQQRAYFYTAVNALALDLDEYAIPVDVSWVSDPNVETRDEAATTYNNGDGTYEIRFSNSFRGPGGAAGSFRVEVAAHEIGHVITFAAGNATQTLLAALFRANADYSVFDSFAQNGGAWKADLKEGVCETFKEAFLPRSQRTYANRTDAQIPYGLYPSFRAILRNNVTAEDRRRMKARIISIGGDPSVVDAYTGTDVVVPGDACLFNKEYPAEADFFEFAGPGGDPFYKNEEEDANTWWEMPDYPPLGVDFEAIAFLGRAGNESFHIYTVDNPPLSPPFPSAGKVVIHWFDGVGLTSQTQTMVEYPECVGSTTPIGSGTRIAGSMVGGGRRGGTKLRRKHVTGHNF